MPEPTDASSPAAAGAGPSAPQRVALSQELTEFLLDLAIALNHFGMYPPGHPALERAALDVSARLVPLLVERATLSFGVARRQLVIEGVATDAGHPVLSSLASRLHRHHVGAVTLQRGADPEEIAGLLRALGAEPEGAASMVAGQVAALPQWDTIRLYPLTYDQLELVEDDGGDGAQDGAAVRAAQLWVGLARAAMPADGSDASPVEVVSEPAAIAEAINEHPRAAAYDQVIVGYLLQLAQELKDGDGPGSATVRRRMSRLIAGLDEATLGRLVEMGGDAGQRQKFALDAARGFAADAVIEVVRATASASGQPVSDLLLGLLSKLADQAAAGDTPGAHIADHELRLQVTELVTGWSLDDPRPSAYTDVLAVLARNRLEDDHPTTARFGLAEPDRVVQMALETGAGGPATRDAADALVAAGRIRELLGFLNAIPAENPSAAAIWSRLARPETLLAMLRAEPIDGAALGSLVTRMGLDAAPTLFDEMARSDSRLARLAALDQLAALGPEVGPRAAERLADERWYVVRNLLTLLRMVGYVPVEKPVQQLLRHADPRVRREALKLLLASREHRDRALCIGLTDADVRNIRISLTAAGDGYPAAAVSLLIRRIDDPSATSEMRVQAIRVLRAERSSLVLDALLRLCAPRRTLFGRPRIAAAVPEVIEGIAVLATKWAGDVRAAAVVSRAARSRDAGLKAAASGRTPGTMHPDARVT